MKKTIKGWKVFDKDLQCLKFQFEVGITYKHDGKIALCEAGFHFHENQKDLFQYYAFDSQNRVCEVLASKVVTGDDKSVCSEITIGKELNWNEVLNLVNIGKDNTGRLNTGDRNTGDRNTGDRNTGYRNTGDMNTGYRNTGDRNTGYRNTGDRNTGYRNTGDRNTGDMNTGDMNTTNFSAGIFNTKEQLTPIFNGAAMVLMSEFKKTDNYRALFSSSLPLTEWIYESDMTDEEKEQHPKFYVQEGYLKVRTFHEACEIWWKTMSESNKKLIQEIPGFDKEIFAEVTGIKL